ncbi:MAG: hypothetical protein DBX59_03960 [Bacillota bacterium]|nr:MAG: hypothetical protein DBX59_03960 [Bacillota bacterium]
MKKIGILLLTILVMLFVSCANPDNGTPADPNDDPSYSSGDGDENDGNNDDGNGDSDGDSGPIWLPPVIME